MLIWIMYLLGWFLHQALLIQNSLKSNTNGLDHSVAGLKAWIAISWVQTLIRLLIVVCIGQAAINGPGAKLNALLMNSGFELSRWGLAGLTGLSTDTLVYQVMGMIPGLRKEVAAVAPPPSDLPK
jgi:hypothetical protein